MSVVAVLVAGLVAMLFWRQVAAVLLVVLLGLVLGGVAYFAQLVNDDGYSTGWASSPVGRSFGVADAVRGSGMERAS